MLARALASGWVPEAVLRAGIRATCALRLYEERRRRGRSDEDAWRRGDIAVATDAANAQHYELPAAFFARVLGPQLKYSACYWPDGTSTLARAEDEMLALSAARAGLVDGQHVLDLGCGWGSFALWAAARFPNSRITAISNSRSQRGFVEARAAERGLTNVTVRTADVRTLELPDGAFDRVVSIEMLEHVRNHAALLDRIARWLRADGALFVHVFAHRNYAYPFEDRGASDWMAREFFTGGIMPSVALLRDCSPALRLADEWIVDGTHYARTAEAWYANLVAARRDVEPLVGRAGYHKWRVFFLACAELFAYRDGREWLVAHYQFTRR